MAEKACVSAVIVNWNGAVHLRICLPSLLAQSYKALEIIVVDNGSSDDSEEVANSFQVKWLALKENVGLAPALNRGAAVATGDFLLFVNNDMRFDREFVVTLVSALVKDETIFAVDGMQFSWEGSVPGHMATRLTQGHPPRVSSVEMVPGLYFYMEECAEITPVFMASAACMLVRKEVFEKLGGFDARLPLGYEDAEICWRAWIHGWKTMYVPQAICWHRVGSSTGSEEGLRFNFRGILRGRLLVATKLLPLRYAFWSWMVSTAGLAKDLGRLRWQFAKDRIRVLIEFSRLIPQFLREKKQLFRTAGISADKQLEDLLQLSVAREGPASVAKMGKKGEPK
jgi:GT2 family glycosyltransferase